MATRKGVTLTEVVVSMAIFLTITTLIMGAFLAVVRVRSLTGNMRDSQQKIRFAVEKISRLTRQAREVKRVEGPDKQGISILYRSSEGGYRAEFYLLGPADNRELKEKECTWLKGQNDCSLATVPERDMLGGSVHLSFSSFLAVYSNPGSIYNYLDIKLTGKIDGLAPYFEDKFTVQNQVTLEGVN